MVEFRDDEGLLEDDEEPTPAEVIVSVESFFVADLDVCAHQGLESISFSRSAFLTSR